MTRCLFNHLVNCMAIFTNKKQKQVKIFTVIYYKMPIPCNNMVIPLKTPISRYPVVSCGNQTDPGKRVLQGITVCLVSTILGTV